LQFENLLNHRDRNPLEMCLRFSHRSFPLETP
jgi:hypothetical protein